MRTRIVAVVGVVVAAALLASACQSRSSSDATEIDAAVAWQEELDERRAAIERTRSPEAERAIPTEPTPGTLTIAQRNAVRSANAYLRLSGFSRQGLIDQLSSGYGDGYDVGDATVAVDDLSINWNAQATRSATAYLEMSGFSCRGLIDQLSSEFGDKYTREQATYGATQAGIC